MTRCENICGDQRFRLPPTFSLLWTLDPEPSLECPISFSPFLPFGTLGNTAGNGGVFYFTVVLHKVYWIDIDFYANIGRLTHLGQPM